MVRRHIAQGQCHVRDQLKLADRLRDLGASTELAEELLALFEATLAAHEDHLRRLETGHAA